MAVAILAAELVLALVLLIAVAVFEYKRIKKPEVAGGFYRGLKDHSFAVYFAVLLCTAGLVYWQFLLFRKVYIYSYDIASDSYLQNFPMFLHLADYLKQTGFPFWSFNVGLGQNIYASAYIEPFTLFAALFGRNIMPFLLGYMQVAKILLAGSFFYGYLRLLPLSRSSAMVGGLLYSFCGEMIARGGWFSYPLEVVSVAVLLYCFELFLQKDKWPAFAVGMLVLGVLLRGYYVLLFTMIIACYGIVRFILVKRFNIKEFLIFLSKSAAAVILGLGMSAVIAVPSLYYQINSPRVSGGNSMIGTLVHTPLYTINSLEEMTTTFFRMLQSDLMGSASNFTGVGNYLEAPLFYCGLLTLLLVPQAFRYYKRKQKIVHGLMLFVTMLYLFSTYFRLILNGFSGGYFKISGFFVVVVWLYLMAHALETIYRHRSVNLPLLLCTAAFLAVPVVLTMYFKPKYIVEMVAGPVVVLIVLYTLLLLYAGGKLPRALLHSSMPGGQEGRMMTAKIAIFLLSAFEVITFSYNTVNNRILLRAQDVNSGTGYYDDTNNAVTIVKNRDKGFYRMEKDYVSVFLCDSIAQQFYGTKSYQGFNSAGTLEFYTEMAPKQMIAASYLYGFGSDPLFNSFVSVKYYISQSPKLKIDGFDRIGGIGKLSIYENRYAVPFGTVYTKYITHADFDKLSDAGKKLTLLSAVVLEDGAPAPAGLTQTQGNNFSGKDGSLDYLAAYENSAAALSKTALSISSQTQNEIKGEVTNVQAGEMFFTIPFDPGWLAYVDGKKVPTRNLSCGFTGFSVPAGQHEIRVSFIPPLFKESAVVSLISIGLYAAAVALYLFLRRRKMAE